MHPSLLKVGQCSDYSKFQALAGRHPAVLLSQGQRPSPKAEHAGEAEAHEPSLRAEAAHVHGLPMTCHGASA